MGCDVTEMAALPAAQPRPSTKHGAYACGGCHKRAV
jgi:hypothetical protein